MEKATILTVRVPLRIARIMDFVVGVKEKRIGLQYFLKNSEGNIEGYEFSETTNTEELNNFIKQKRCYVIATVKFADYDAKLEEREFNWIDNGVKQK